MFEEKTFEVILNEALEQVPNDVDKREGSIIYDALAPTALKLAEAYSFLDWVLRVTFADSADGEFLTRRVGEFGVNRKQASPAIRKISITNSQEEPMSVPIGTLFSLDGVNYEIEEELALGSYKAKAQTEGVVGNISYGDLLPLGQIQGLGRALLEDVLVPGEEEESDESLYQKYLEHIRDKAFGGNRADYKKKTLEIQGVGGVRLYRAPQGGGTVKVVFIDSAFNTPSQELVDTVQETLDPIAYAGDGYGTAPIGHTVLVEGAPIATIAFETTLSLKDTTIEQARPFIEAALEDFFLDLRKQWITGEEVTIRIARLESKILELEGIEDIVGTKLNGLEENISLAHELPVLGGVVLNE